MSDDADAMLKMLLAAPERGPDERFAARIERLVRAEETLRAARRRAWSRFAVEMAAAAALLLAFLLIDRLGPGDSQDSVPLFSPIAAGLLLLALWVGLSNRGEMGPADH